ncbi:MAG: DUF1015 family protein [Myxococcota bacterium]|jgi:uncharacterized protein (DUF1015 family)|nr:DUF1015 family protein [Myxococcota bacterium]
MAQLLPFRGVRPLDELAERIIAPPYDVLSEDEARSLTRSNPRSFLHVTRPEVSLPLGSDPHGPQAYAVARSNLGRFLEQGWLIQDDGPCFYLYGQTWKGRSQVGLMAICSVDEYDQGRIKRHELTRPDKEQDRVDHISALGTQTGLVFLAYRDQPEVQAALDQAARLPPTWSVVTEDQVEHSLTVVADQNLVEAIQLAFTHVPALYIADGHHRSAAASRVRERLGGSGSSSWFLAGVYPDVQLEVLAYNRIVRDLNGHSPEELLQAISSRFEVTHDTDPVPSRRGCFTMYIQGRWSRLSVPEADLPDDPVASLDVALLQDRLLEPLLGIENPRTDQRIGFVGGIRGHQALEDAVNRGDAAIAFHMFPTGMDQLFAVADADLLMPPKSTWFEPKLRGGVVMHRFTGDSPGDQDNPASLS